MIWQGHKIRDIAGQKRLSLANLARQIGVSRQTINDWIGGQVPKGNHLLQLCDILNQSPDAFFSQVPASLITVPVHRNRKNSKITDITHAEALEFSREYLNIFRNHANNAVVPVIRSSDQGRTSCAEIAAQLKELVKLESDQLLDIEATFRLLSKLGIYTIFRTFPQRIKSYAFYTRIADHRVVFVNKETKIIDLIFPLLHEAVHAVSDEEPRKKQEYDEDEEEYCDLIACLMQFPKSYIDFLYGMIHEMQTSFQINTLKMHAVKYSHSLYGVAKAIRMYYPDFSLDPNAADTNLRKEVDTIGQMLTQDHSLQQFVQKQYEFSPLFTELVTDQIQELTIRKIAELFELSTLDAKEVQSLLASQSVVAEAGI